MNRIIIGVDPGPTTGIVALHLGPLAKGEPAYSPQIIQCDRRSVLSIVDWLAGSEAMDPAVLAVEQFVVGPRSGRSAHAGAGRIARELLGELQALHVRMIARSAGAVKPWATDVRLRAVGLWTPVGVHARDAARHALFAAVHDFAAPDPLSRRAGARG